MESLQSIKSRIKGVKNINQITKAMELVAATKMRRSQAIALASRPYAFAALELLGNLARLEPELTGLSPVLAPRTVKKEAYVLVTSDKGLAGSFNGAVIRAFEKYVRAQGVNLKSAAAVFIAVGKKAAQYLERRVSNLPHRFIRVGDYTTVAEIRPIAEALFAGYLAGDWDKVTVFSMHFRSALNQEVVQRELLPISFAGLLKTAEEIVPEKGRFATERAGGNGAAATLEYLIEPSAREIVDKLAGHLLLMEIYHLVLEANASEHAARRMAMKNASDNAEELAHGLTLAYNKSRQAAITKEILEITAGAESLK